MGKAAKASTAKTISIISIMPAGGAGGPAGEIATIPGGKGVELQSFGLPGWISSRKEVDFSEFMERWRVVKDQVGTMISDLTKQTFGKMALDEVEVSIAVSGEGSIGIATAKGEASIVLKFKKP